MSNEMKKVLKGLEACQNKRCDKCPYDLQDFVCWHQLMQDAIDTIVDLREAGR